MSSSDRDANEANPKKKMKWLHTATSSGLLRYNNSDRRKRPLAKLQYIFTRTFCDLQMPRYGR